MEKIRRRPHSDAAKKKMSVAWERWRRIIEYGTAVAGLEELSPEALAVLSKPETIAALAALGKLVKREGT
jgi:hypothetical protein